MNENSWFMKLATTVGTALVVGIMGAALILVFALLIRIIMIVVAGGSS